MSVFDIQVTNSSLHYIEGGISTGGVNGTWISNAYLIGEIISIMYSDFLRRLFTFRYVFITSAILFLVFSVGCSFTTSLDQMIILRVLQGMSTGVMVPLALTILVEKIPESKQSVGMAIFALTATLGPALGPWLGGYITTVYNWRYLFYLNLLPGMIMLGMLVPTLDKEKMDFSFLKKADWLGMVSYAIGIACLLTAMSQGNPYNWLYSPYIVKLLIVSGLFLILFLASQYYGKNPLIPFSVFDHYFSRGALANVLMGSVLFAMVYILPNYLTQVCGYDAAQVGTVMMWAGVPQLFIIPFVPWLLKYIDARVLAGFGFFIFAVGCFMNSYLSYNFQGPQFFEANIIRAVGKALALAPLTIIAFHGVRPEYKGKASAVYNMIRSLAGAVGTGILATVVTRRATYHANIIGSAATSNDPNALQILDTFKAYITTHGMTDPILAERADHQLVGEMVEKQALIMGNSNAFFVMGLILLAGMVVVACVKPLRPMKVPNT